MFALFFSSVVSAQNSLLFEDFNAGWPAGWEMYDLDTLTPNSAVSYVDTAWIVVEDSDSTGIGDSCMLSNSWYDPIGQSYDMMVLPAVTLGASGNFLSWDARSEDPAFPDSYEIKVSLTGNTPADFADTSFFYVVDESPYWQQYKVRLDSFANQTVYIAFVNRSDDKYLLMIDNIGIVESDPMSIEDQDLALDLYPNPAIEQLKIEGAANNTVRLYSLEGKVHTTQANNGVVEVSEFARGLYIVETEINGILRRSKVILQ